MPVGICVSECVHVCVYVKCKEKGESTKCTRVHRVFSGNTSKSLRVHVDSVSE